MDENNNQDKIDIKTPDPILKPKEPKGEIKIESKPPQADSEKADISKESDKKSATDPKKESGSKSKLKSKPLIIGLIITIFIVIILFLVLMVFGGGADPEENPQDVQISATPIPEPNVTSSPELIPKTDNSDDEEEFKAFRSDKLIDLDFPGYLITYPKDWIIQNQRLDSDPSSKVTLLTNGHVLVIDQRNFQNDFCLYDNDGIPTGSTYLNLRDSIYKEIYTNFGSLRRTEEKISNSIVFTYCEEQRVRLNYNKFQHPTSIGKITIQGPAIINTVTLAELEDVIINLEEIY